MKIIYTYEDMVGTVHQRTLEVSLNELLKDEMKKDMVGVGSCKPTLEIEVRETIKLAVEEYL